MAEVMASDGRDPYEEKCVKEYSNGTASEGSNHIQMNGVTNGHSGDKSKDKHRDKDKHHKDKHRDKDRDKNREKDKEKDRSKHSSSSKDKDKHSSSSSSKDKDKSRDKDHKSSSSSKDKDRERDKSSSKDKDRSDKYKSSSSSSGHKSSSSSKDKEKSSSSSSKDKDKSHSSSNKDKERSKDKDKEREKDKHKDRSKDKDKERKDKDRKSSDGDRQKDKERSKEKSKHDSDRKDKDKYKDKEREKKYEEKVEVKRELESPVAVKEERLSISPVAIKRADTDDSLDDTSLNMDSFKQEEYSSFKEEPSSIDDDNDQDQSYVDRSVKREDSDDEDSDAPLASRKSLESSNKRKAGSDSEEDKPLLARAGPKKVKKEVKKEVKKRKSEAYDSEDEDLKPKKKKKKAPVKQEAQLSPTKKKKKEEEEQQVWKWWEEEKKEDGVKWRFLEHKGPLFAPPYEPLPDNVKFFYDGKEISLSELAEEVATFYAKMLEHDYTTKPVFNNNFFKDWRKVMTDHERSIITDLKKCNFKPMNKYFNEQSEIRKAMSKEEKKKIKEKNDEIQKEMGFCTIDGHQEKIGNFRIEPPGLFRGRGEHPKMGMLKRRVNPEDVIINCSKDSKVPKAPAGHRWKEVRHDNKVTWLASWTENVQGQVKYVMLNPSSKLKGEKDWQKYEIARKLAKTIDKIRDDYRQDWKSKEMRIRQRAVAMYFIDKLALRAGNEKDAEDQADTVGCCSLRVEHISLEAEKDGKENVVIFDFPGKDSIRYYNEVPVEKRVFKNLQLFMEKKQGGDDLFDRLNTGILNKHLSDLMEGLTAKVFRTYNASWTLQEQLNLLTNPDDTVAEKILAYNRANRAVAILCNHQRSVPKSHDKSMENLKGKIEAKRELVEDAEKKYKEAKRNRSADTDKKKKALDRLREQLNKLEIQETDREENKTIALGTSKLNYLDPRISVAWCKKFDVPIEKIYNKTQRDKFRWAIDMAEADYVF